MSVAVTALSLLLGVLALLVGERSQSEVARRPLPQGSAGGASLRVTPLERCGFGAEVSGLDLRDAAAPATERRLRLALREHGLVLCRQPGLEESEVLRFAAAFGEPVPPTGQQWPLAVYRVRDRDRTPRGADFWHSDNSFRAAPGGPTALYALRVPAGPGGGAAGRHALRGRGRRGRGAPGRGA